MTRISRLALMMSCSLSLGACGHIDIPLPKLFQTAVSQPTQTAAPISARVWPQTASDIAPDPKIRFGTLSNGMRYALLKNATPTGQAAIRLRFDAGSLMETDAQQGLAQHSALEQHAGPGEGWGQGWGQASSSPRGPNTTVNSSWAIRLKPGSSFSW